MTSALAFYDSRIKTVPEVKLEVFFLWVKLISFGKRNSLKRKCFYRMKCLGVPATSSYPYLKLPDKIQDVQLTLKFR